MHQIFRHQIVHRCLVFLAAAIVISNVGQHSASKIRNDSVKVPATCATTYPVARVQINAGFGLTPDPFNPGQTRFHTGIDFDGKIGDPIYSPVCGVVVYLGKEQDKTNYEWGYGWHLKVRDAKNRLHLFGHISKALIKVGDKVFAGQKIAKIGNNGNSTGSHLHYEVREGGDDYAHAVNPMDSLKQRQKAH